MIDIGLGLGLLLIALTAQYIIKKRTKNPNSKTAKAYSWIAWIGALVGGTAVTADIQDTFGITSNGAAIVACLMLLFIIIDLSDRRPDWLAFFLICFAPTFMTLASGGIGNIFDGILMAPRWAAGSLAGFMGA